MDPAEQGAQIPIPQEMMAAMMTPPAVVTREISTWTRFRFAWKDVTGNGVDANPEDGQRTFMLIIEDEETGNRHEFYFSENGKANLLHQITGGVILP